MAHSLGFARNSWMVGACLLLSAVAAAKEPTRSPEAPSRDAAEDDPLHRGRQALAARHWLVAEAALEAALAPEHAGRLTPVERAEVMGEIGLCELEQRKVREAAEHLSRSLDHFSSLRPAVRQRFNKALGEALKQVGWVFFSVDPPDAAVLLDGKPMGRAGAVYEFFVAPGQHMIRARLDGHQDVVQVFDIDAGKKHQISMHLPKALPAAAGGVAVQPKAVAGKAAVPTAKGASGAGKVPWVPLRIAGGVLAAGGVVAGGILLLRADATRDELEGQRDALLASTQAADGQRGGTGGDETCTRNPRPAGCATLRDLRNQEYALRTAGWVTLGVGSALGALTLSSLLLPRGRPASGQVVVWPTVAAGQSGIVLTGTW